jgi:hypothetical protein
MCPYLPVLHFTDLYRGVRYIYIEVGPWEPRIQPIYCVAGPGGPLPPIWCRPGLQSAPQVRDQRAFASKWRQENDKLELALSLTKSPLVVPFLFLPHIRQEVLSPCTWSPPGHPLDDCHKCHPIFFICLICLICSPRSKFAAQGA